MTKFVKSAAVAVIGAGLFAGGMWAGVAVAHPSPRIAACVTEDGSGPSPCLWDAKTRGNGRGQSFISVDGNPDGRIVYLP